MGSRIESIPEGGASENPEEAAAGQESAPQEFQCDFCGARVSRVRRVALDRDYDRLQARHSVQYACPDCSEKKDRQRLGRRGD